MIGKEYIFDKVFEKVNYTVDHLPKGDYEACQFIGCDLSNSDLAEINFTDCSFISCNLSSAIIRQTTFADVKFKDSKMFGLHFEDCNEFIFSASFDGCSLNFSSFYKRKIRKTSFNNCKLIDVDFSECDLSSSVFTNCDMLNARFDNTILERADLSSAFNYSIDPVLNRIKRARFSYPGLTGLLDKFDIDLS